MVILLAAWTAGCAPVEQTRTATAGDSPANENSFSVLFQKKCVGCHGALGTLGPAPPLNDKLFLALLPERELSRVIAEGRPGTLMPAFARTSGGDLPDEQVKILAEGIKSRWGSSEPAPSGAPPYLLEQAHKASGGTGTRQAGLAVFARACASCHGDHGQGGKGAGAINDPDFLSLLSDQALRRIVITGRPDLGMPNYADPTGRIPDFKPLTDQDVADVGAVLAGWRRGEAVDPRGK
jgi:mono/diheme cytochrome c family protein